MTKRYQCDYCNKIFPDTPQHRESHLKAFSHLLQVRFYYDRFRILQDNSVRRPPLPCKKLYLNGFCDEASGRCTYSHRPEDRLADIGDVPVRDMTFIPVNSHSFVPSAKIEFQTWQSIPLELRKTFPPSMIYANDEISSKQAIGETEEASWG